MMNHFGKRVKAIRLEQNITKEDFCGDETELSIRQLTRIESGECMPTLSKVEFIANRLGIKIGDLTDKEQFILPKRYKEIKYLLLHTQTYMDSEKIAVRNAYFEEIYTSFFDDLPEEEQLIIELLDSQMEFFANDNNYSAQKILKEYFYQMIKKVSYEMNDLIFLHLYFHYIQTNREDDALCNISNSYIIIENLLNQSQKFPIEQIFMLNRVLISAFGGTEFLINNPYAEKIISTLETNITKAQDFQKMPILYLMKWKYEIYKNKNLEMAISHFENACIFAKLTQETHLLTKLKTEWENDRATLILQ